MKKLNSFVDYIRKFPPGIFFVAILVIAVMWTKLLGAYFWGDFESVDNKMLYSLLIQQPKIALYEELLWRFLPFTIASIIWIVGVKLKIPNIILIAITLIPILFIQIEFGLGHVLNDQALRSIMDLPIYPTLDEKIPHIVVQGGIGIILSFTYFKYLLQSKGILKYVQIIPLLVCSLIHMFNNQIILYLGHY